MYGQKNFRGFTLIEILIAIAILSLSAIIAIPNLRRFNDEQELNNASEDIVRTFREAQSSAASNIRCNNGPSGKWFVELNNVAGVNYKLLCQNSSGVNESSPRYQKNWTGISLGGVTSCAATSANSLKVEFVGNSITYWCGATSFSPANSAVSIVITKNSRSKTISINVGGVISSN